MTVMRIVSGSRRLVVSVMLLILPTWMARPFVNVLGHQIARGARIGYSWIDCHRLNLGDASRIGHFNVISLDRLVMRNLSQIGAMNLCRGPLRVFLSEGAVLGNRNTVTRAPRGVTIGLACLWLGQGSKITAGHSLDCAQSIRMEQYSTLAGKGSQIWTHGYVHEEGSGVKRYRVDGRIYIGKNVYLASRVIINGGVRICDEASVGVGTCVTKDLTDAAFYVSGALRKLPKPRAPEARADMQRIRSKDLIETVYLKRDASS